MLLTTWLHPPRSALRTLRRFFRRTPPRRRNRLHLDPHLPAPAIELLEDRTLLSNTAGLDLLSDELDHEDQSAESLSQDRSASDDAGVAPDLPGLTLVDTDTSSWQGQIIYLDFDGAEDVTYNGPVTVGPFDVPAFEAPGELAGHEEEIIGDVVAHLETTFVDTGLSFTTDRPDSSSAYSTVFAGGESVEFSEYGHFLGLSETVDVGNQNKTDEAFVFTNEFRHLDSTFSATDALVACSPKADPVVMRVSTARRGKETHDDEETQEAAFAGADRQEAAGCGCPVERREGLGGGAAGAGSE